MPPRGDSEVSHDSPLALPPRALHLWPPRLPVPVEVLVNTRRQFLIQAPIILGAIAGCNKKEQTPAASTPTTPGAPPTFGTAPETGPEVSAGTFAEAEKLMQVTMTPEQRNMAVKSWRRSMAAQLERRTGPRKLALEPTLSPATRWDPALPGNRGWS